MDPFSNGEHQLKVDCAAFKSAKQRQREYFLVVYTINLPSKVVYNPEQRLDALKRVSLLLQTDFGPTENVDYQITGTYLLHNTKTNEIKTWVKSFFMGLNNPAIIQNFSLFKKNTFVSNVFQALDTADSQLLHNEIHSRWQLKRLQSVSIVAQCIVYNTHQVLQIRKLNRRNKKFRNTFTLPEKNCCATVENEQ